MLCLSAWTASTSPAWLPGDSFDRGADAAPGRSPGSFQVPIEPDSCRLADQVVLGHEAPDTPVLTVVPVVAHHEITSGRNRRFEQRPLQTCQGIGVGAVLTATVVTARLAAIAACRSYRARKQRHRAQHRLVNMFPEVLLGELHVDVAAVVVRGDDLERNRLTVDRNAI